MVLADTEGLNDLSRLSIDIGQGEGGIVPNDDVVFVLLILKSIYIIYNSYKGGLTADAEGSAYKRYQTTVTAMAIV